MGLEIHPVRSFIGVPEGYKKTVLSEAKALAREVDPCGANCNKVEQGTRDRWKEITALEPPDSRFTLIVPIHNEERYLPAALSSLAVSDIPSSAHVNFVFVTNNSTDRSSEIVRQFMSNFGPVTQSTFEDEQMGKLGDLGLNPNFDQTTHGNMNFSHIETATQGKANALNLGNALAIEKGDKIAISMDANNFVEPDAVASIFGTAYDAIVRNPDGTALLCAEDIHEAIKSKKTVILKKLKEKSAINRASNQIIVAGWMMAWDADFVNSIGGVPPVAIEDYALGVVTRMSDRKIKRDEKSRIWGYESLRIADRYAQNARFIRGRLQLLAKGGRIAEIAKSDDTYMTGSLVDRAKIIGRRIKDKPLNAPYYGAKFVFWEAALAKAKRDFKNDPDRQSWDPITSTKG